MKIMNNWSYLRLARRLSPAAAGVEILSLGGNGGVTAIYVGQELSGFLLYFCRTFKRGKQLVFISSGVNSYGYVYDVLHHAEEQTKQAH